MIYADCTITCERMPRCAVCQDIKKPIGRSAPLDTVYCSSHGPIQAVGKPLPPHFASETPQGRPGS